MNSAVSQLRTGPDPVKRQNNKLKILMVCQNHLAGVDAVGALADLARRVGGTPEMTVQDVWSFAMLEEPRLRKLAAREASMADIVLVCTRGRGEFPDGVRKWLHLWVGDVGSSTKVLAALLDESDKDVGEPFPIATYLQHCARLARLQFTIRNIGLEPEIDESDFARIGERAMRTADVIHQVLRDCWGSSFLAGSPHGELSQLLT